MSVSCRLNNNVRQSAGTSCYYASTGHAGKFYVVCMNCDPFHGVVSQKTKKLVPFVRHAEAEQMCKILNNYGGVAC